MNWHLQRPKASFLLPACWRQWRCLKSHDETHKSFHVVRSYTTACCVPVLFAGVFERFLTQIAYKHDTDLAFTPSKRQEIQANKPATTAERNILTMTKRDIPIWSRMTAGSVTSEHKALKPTIPSLPRAFSMAIPKISPMAPVLHQHQRQWLINTPAAAALIQVGSVLAKAPLFVLFSAIVNCGGINGVNSHRCRQV